MAVTSLDTADLGRLVERMTSMATAVDDAERIERIRQPRAMTAAAGEVGLARRILPAQARTWVGNARVLMAELP